ncbi:MAG: bifunctional riboflavin kinase/FAD synthetase [Cyanobacteria bacterium P01_F01_bin.42]
MWIASSLEQVLTPAAIALGNFDGLHLGHQEVIRALPSQPGQAFYRTVLAFNPHPREFFSGRPQSLLTPMQEKIALLESAGVDQLLLLPFNRALAALNPEEFFREILVESLRARHISVGFNFQFGRDRTGTTDDLVRLGEKYGVPVQILTAQTVDCDRVSSSSIKAALESGDVALANQLLGRSYTLSGMVVKGQQLGRTIGFPTANLQVPEQKFLPRRGVYRVQVRQENSEKILNGVMNIGCRPTVDGQNSSIEVHVFDWSEDLYGQTLTVFLAEFLRPEQKFGSLAELQAQIQLDCDTARSQLTSVV